MPEDRSSRRKITITLRLSPIIHAAVKREADRQGLTTSRFITESILLRVGYLLGAEAGAISSPFTLEQDAAMQKAVRDLLREDFLHEKDESED